MKFEDRVARSIASVFPVLLLLAGCSATNPEPVQPVATATQTEFTQRPEPTVTAKSEPELFEPKIDAQIHFF
jgi:PBP1b-binding outer membrane lipoprotein LpoB